MPPSNHPSGLTLSELKRQLRGRYLGKYGIHALGTRSSEDAICVYVTPGVVDQAEALQKLRSEVAPHRMLVIEEESPRAV